MKRLLPVYFTVVHWSQRNGENQGCCTRENHQQCSHIPLHCLLLPSSYCSYQVSFPSRWVHLPLLLFFHYLSALLPPYITNLVSLRLLPFEASCSSSSWVPAMVEVSHRRQSSLPFPAVISPVTAVPAGQDKWWKERPALPLLQFW